MDIKEYNRLKSYRYNPLDKAGRLFSPLDTVIEVGLNIIAMMILVGVGALLTLIFGA